MTQELANFVYKTPGRVYLVKGLNYDVGFYYETLFGAYNAQIRDPLLMTEQGFQTERAAQEWLLERSGCKLADDAGWVPKLE